MLKIYFILIRIRIRICIRLMHSDPAHRLSIKDYKRNFKWPSMKRYINARCTVRYLWELNLIKNGADSVVFLTQTLFKFENFSIIFYKKETFAQSAKKINRLNKQNMDLIQTLSNKAFQGTVVNQALLSLHIEGHLKINLQSL